MTVKTLALSGLLFALLISTSNAQLQRLDSRVDNSTKGSLLAYSKVDLRWGAGGQLRQDTILEITNDFSEDVYVQLYFVNGDEPRDPIFAGDPPELIVEGEPGWNWVDCQVYLTANQPLYWSAATGNPLGCQPFAILDPDEGNGPGRPDPERPLGRVLRGFVYAWAVDADGLPIQWNHLSGSATIVGYGDTAAWEYNAWAFQSLATDGSWSDDSALGHGHLSLDGQMYQAPYDRLLMNFYASGSQALSSGRTTVSLDTDLTLYPVSADLRQDGSGPITTKAQFDIWNENENRFSGTTRCITCWDQTLLSNYDAPNHFLIQNLQTDKGKARIDGVQSTVCDNNCTPDTSIIDGTNEGLGNIKPIGCSQDAALLGVVSKVVAFSGILPRTARSGQSLVGMGSQNATILYDIVTPPGELRDQAYQRAGMPIPFDSDDVRVISRTAKQGSDSRSMRAVQQH